MKYSLHPEAELDLREATEYITIETAQIGCKKLAICPIKVLNRCFVASIGRIKWAIDPVKLAIGPVKLTIWLGKFSIWCAMISIWRIKLPIWRA